MNTIRKKTGEIFFYLLILMILSLSCKDNSELYNITVYNPVLKGESYYGRSPIIIPICNQQDSVYCCLTPDKFYNKLNIKMISEEEFSKKNYENIVKKKFVEISNDFFLELKNDSCLIYQDKGIFLEYKEKGVLYLLKKYTNKYGELTYDDISMNKIHYIYYLAFINGIYFYWSDEGGPGYFLDNNILRKIKNI